MWNTSMSNCRVCKRPIVDAFVCRRCANELRDLLIGSRKPDGQPGVVWYAARLREAAYRQTRMSESVPGASSGYALLGNRRAAELLDRIGNTLALWEGVTLALSVRYSHKPEMAGMGAPTRDFERLEGRRARFVASHVMLLRHHSPRTARLHAELLDIAQQAWHIINRPNDICCGPCPHEVYVTNQLEPCGAMLYAQEGAGKVKCPACKTVHDVEHLRDSLKAQVQDMLFTRAELISLMRTRLNDPIKQPLFTKLLRTRRLQPRKIENGVPMFTYNDVCEARLLDGRRHAENSV